MQVDIQALKEKILERGMTQGELARIISVDKSTFSRKMRSNAEAFSVGEMHKIVEALGLTNEDAKNIFLA